MLHHSLGPAVIFISLQTHIGPVLVEMPILLSQQMRETIRWFNTAANISLPCSPFCAVHWMEIMKSKVYKFCLKTYKF